MVQKPIRRGVIGPTLMVEELGRRRFNHGVRSCKFYMFILLGSKFLSLLFLIAHHVLHFSYF